MLLQLVRILRAFDRNTAEAVPTVKGHRIAWFTETILGTVHTALRLGSRNSAHMYFGCRDGLVQGLDTQPKLLLSVV
jgi:hypothetical protein